MAWSKHTQLKFSKARSEGRRSFPNDLDENLCLRLRVVTSFAASIFERPDWPVPNPFYSTNARTSRVCGIDQPAQDAGCPASRPSSDGADPTGTICLSSHRGL